MRGVGWGIHKFLQNFGQQYEISVLVAFVFLFWWISLSVCVCVCVCRRGGGWGGVGEGACSYLVIREETFIRKVQNNNLSCHTAKPTVWPLRPAKTQISLGIHPVWSRSSLSAGRNIGPLTTYWVPRLIWVFAGLAFHFVGFVMRRLI